MIRKLLVMLVMSSLQCLLAAHRDPTSAHRILAGDTQLGNTCEMICSSWLMMFIGRGLTVAPSASAAPLVDTA